MSPRRSSRHAQCSPVLHSCRDEHLLATHERPALRAASATAGDVAVPNELPAAAEAPYPRVARLFAPAPRCSCWHGCRAGACARRWPRAAASRLTQQSRRDCPNGDKGGVSLGLRAGSSLRTEPMVPLLRLAPPAVCRAPARLECLAGRRSSRWTCIRDRGSGPTRAPPGAGSTHRAGAGRRDVVDQGTAGAAPLPPYCSCEPSGGPAGPGAVLVHE